MGLPLWKRATLIPLLTVALWLLTDADTNDNDNDNDTRDSASDRSSYNHSNRHHLAVLTALHRHPPCRRVYRSLLELNLLLWGVVVSLQLWKRTIGPKLVRHLLFQPPPPSPSPSASDIILGWTWNNDLSNDDPSTASASASASTSMPSVEYMPIDKDDETPLEVEDILTLGMKVDSESGSDQNTPVVAEVDANDGAYDSDGEVAEPSNTVDDDPSTIQWDPPEPVAIAAIAVDSLVLILVSLFFFTMSSAEGGRYVDGMTDVGVVRLVALVAAPLFPLLLFVAGIVALVTPWKKRRDFWTVLSLTVGAPLYQVSFRDGFIGDILTSSVRPMQDIAFTVFYLVSGLRGWWQQSYDLDVAELPLETNWLLHTTILPMCMASPLFWRFLQNLRQCYDHKQRWPYLGNALKYFVAAQVAMFGVFHPSRKQSVAWLSCFVGATLYQIWWDVWMDWELLVWDSHTRRWKLRSTRIYSVRWMYWSILIFNVFLRFCWTLSFVPPNYLNQAGVLSSHFEGDLSHILNPTIAVAELIRRTLWGWLRVELEAIKVARNDPTRFKGAWSDPAAATKTGTKDDYSFDKEVELQVMAMEGVETEASFDSNYRNTMHPTKSGWITSDMYHQSDLAVLGELCVYATAFTALGLLAAAHRVTL